MVIRKDVTLMVLVTALAMHALGAAGAVRSRTLTGMDAVRFLYQQGDYPMAKRASLSVLWKDMRQPEALHYLTRSLVKLNEREQAAVFYHLMLRVLEEGSKDKSDPLTEGRKQACRKALKVLDKNFEAEKKKYVESAAGKKFTSPQKVDDLWMTQVRCTLRSLHGLYAWRLLGGRKDASKDWIHNKQGSMQRSGAKYMKEVHGRKGVLFCNLNRDSKDLSRMTWLGPVKGTSLRIGTRAYGFPFVLKVNVGKKEIFSQKIGKNAWTDLIVPLGSEPAEGQEIALELRVPEGQKWHEGAFFDYVDFFEAAREDSAIEEPPESDAEEQTEQ